jgi:hypothetical protein
VCAMKNPGVLIGGHDGLITNEGTGDQ